jgi:hypothetical protein
MIRQVTSGLRGAREGKPWRRPLWAISQTRSTVWDAVSISRLIGRSTGLRRPPTVRSADISGLEKVLN